MLVPLAVEYVWRHDNQNYDEKHSEIILPENDEVAGFVVRVSHDRKLEHRHQTKLLLELFFAALFIYSHVINVSSV